MLTKGDDYPIHQTPEPIAFSGTDRNFYDRYFFNGYTRDGSVYFTTALGVYPHLNIIDAAFCVVHNGVQHNLHASGFLNMERLNTEVGPIKLEVLEPLQSLKITVKENEYGIRAEITFHARIPAIKEPRFTWRNGTRALMDYTRFTQNGTYEGWIEVNDDRIILTRDAILGTRDRSWGVRPIGEKDPQPLVPPMEPQFYWLWAPLNFEDRITLYHVNEDKKGFAYNTAAVMCQVNGEEPEEMEKCWSKITYKSGSRHAKAASLFLENKAGELTTIELTIHWHYYMLGMGYNHPEWGHGAYKGELAVGYESFRTDDITTSSPPYHHIQAFVTARMTLPDGEVLNGAGILEQMIVGPHEPSGFKNGLEVAP